MFEPGQRSGKSGDADPLTSMHVQRALAGSHEDLAWIVARFSPALRIQARYRLGRRLQGLYDADDLLQDVWTTALPRLATLAARDGRLTPVLLKFLSTTLLNRHNTLLQKHIQGKPLRSEGERSGADPVSQLTAQTTDALGRAIRSELEDEVSACIDELSPQDREVLVLRGIEQSSNQSVALLLGIPANTVAVRYRRALERLRGRLPGSLFDELDTE